MGSSVLLLVVEFRTDRCEERRDSLDDSTLVFSKQADGYMIRLLEVS